MEKPKKRGRKLLIILIVLLLICLLGAALVFIFLRLGAAGPVSTSPGPTSVLFKNDMVIVISPAVITSKSGEDSFVVGANADLTLQSDDTKEHECKISGKNITQMLIKLAGGIASKKFKLPAGKYELECDNISRTYITITAQ